MTKLRHFVLHACALLLRAAALRLYAPMPRCRRHFAMLCAWALGLGAAGCIHREVEDAPRAPETESAEAVADTLGNPLLANRGDINAVNLNVRTSEELEKYDNGSNEELIWTDPDNPDAEIPGLTEAFENSRQGSGWLDNYTQAVRLARSQKLPLIVWFHDSVLSPSSIELANNYLNTKEFDHWARPRVVRLRIDAGPASMDDTSGGVRYNLMKINSMRRIYGVRKRPAVVVISPNGKVTTRIDGYAGNLTGFIEELGKGVLKAEQAYQEYKDKLRGRGYRDWRSRISDKVLFAKVLRVDDKKQLVYFKEDGGRISHTRLSSLSHEDIDYLDTLRRQSEQKRRQQAEDEETESDDE